MVLIKGEIIFSSSFYSHLYQWSNTIYIIASLYSFFTFVIRPFIIIIRPFVILLFNTLSLLPVSLITAKGGGYVGQGSCYIYIHFKIVIDTLKRHKYLVSPFGQVIINSDYRRQVFLLHFTSWIVVSPLILWEIYSFSGNHIVALAAKPQAFLKFVIYILLSYRIN